MSRLASLFCPLLILLGAASFASGQEKDPADQLQMKAVGERLRAVSRIVDSGHPKAAALLTRACGDDDWEVVERAAAGLAAHGDEKSLTTLAKLAVSGPLETIRVAAARSLGALDREKAVALLTKKLRGKTAHAAALALVEVGYPEGWKRFEKLIKSEDVEARRAGISGLAATGDPRAAARLAEILEKDDDIAARAAAARALARCGTDEALGFLLARLGRSGVKPVLERRIITAITEVVEGRDGAGAATALTACVRAFEAGKSGPGAAALARLLGHLGRDAARSAACASALLAHGEAAQGAVATALGRCGGADAFAKIAEFAKSSPRAETRILALRAAVETGESGAPALVSGILAADADVAVREEAAVLCGHLLDETTAPALLAALDDESWQVMLAAAVSLGKLQHEAAVAPLTAHLGHTSHLVRASAAAGLGRIARKGVVSPLITALDDPDSLVRDTALDYLQRITRSELAANAKKWTRWWESNEADFKFVDRVAARRRAKKDDEKYDRFRRDPYGAFKDIRVIVLSQSRDKMEKSLEVLEIAHVLTQTGKVSESGLQPNAVFLANCPGNLSADDAERLGWFVRAGGHLFATCVAVSNTVMRTFPGFFKQAPGAANGAGAVDSFPVPTQQDYLHGVFDRHSRPRYQVAGNQLPVATDHDRVNVLVDSPDACTRWGAGSMAAWFSIGHGIVVDSANHFVLQGMANERLKTEDERRAYALERLGLDFREVRDLDRKGVFKSKSKASKACHDRTMMRLVARFVFTRRRSD